MQQRLWLLAIVVFGLLACRPSPKVNTASDAGGPDFDPALPRVALPSLAKPDAARPRAAAPLLTTVPDGSKLRFDALRIRGFIDGPLALTEIHVVVRNVEARTTEASFVVNLPPGGVVTRFGMREQPAGQWQEGRIAEAASVRRHERLLQRGIDPGLVEIDGPDRVRVRIFPMWASSTRDVAISVLHTLPRADEPFRLPLAGVAVGSVDAQVLVVGNGGKKVATFTTPGAPVEDLVLPLRADMGLATAPATISEGGVVARVARGRLDVPGTTTLTSAAVGADGKSATPIVPEPATSGPATIRRLIVAFDTSASREAALAASAERLRAIVAELPDAYLDVACFDQEVEIVYRGPARGFGAAHVARIMKRGASGLSNLDKAARWMERTALSKHAQSHALLFTDGAHVIGPRTRAELAPMAKRLRAAGIGRIDAVVERAPAERGLAALSDLGLATLEPTVSPRQVVEHLAAPLGSTEVKVDGAKWHWPKQIAARADEALVFVESKQPRAVAVTLGGERHGVAALAASKDPNPLVGLGLAYAHIQELSSRYEEAKDGAEIERLRREIVRRSQESGILTEHTAFVVLHDDGKAAERDSKRESAGQTVVVASERPAVRARPGPAPLGGGATSADRDGDGIPDQSDRCPDELAEDEIDYEDADGCPRPENMVQIVVGRPGLLKQPIPFASGQIEPGPAGRALLVEMAAALRRSPRVGLVEIGGHARALRTPDESLKLSDARASAVRAFLVKNGVAADRLVTRPYGATSPRRPHEGEHASENDRVELTVLVVDGKRLAAAGAWPEVLPPPHGGYYGEIEALVMDGGREKAIAGAREWRARSGDPMAFLALGDAYAAAGDRGRAARAYGAFADVFPERPTHWRIAAGYLDRLASGLRFPFARKAPGPEPRRDERRAPDDITFVALDLHRRAAEVRPTFYASARGFAYALWRAGRYEEAFEAALRALREVTPSREGPLGDEKKGELDALLRTDAALLGAAWMRVEPAKKDLIEQRLVEAGAPLARLPSVHFVITWENDASNVDLLVSDGRGGSASPYSRVLRTGGEYRLDVRTGYGPDWFAIDGAPAAGPYRVSVTYSGRGAMGPALGTLSIVEHDGAGRLFVEDRPFVLMNERATLELGTYTPSLARGRR